MFACGRKSRVLRQRGRQITDVLMCSSSVPSAYDSSRACRSGRSSGAHIRGLGMLFLPCSYPADRGLEPLTVCPDRAGEQRISGPVLAVTSRFYPR